MRGAECETYIPQIETNIVANRRDLTNGAKDIDAAKMRCEINQAVARSGLSLLNAFRRGAMLAGGRGVKQGFFSSSGDLTTQGKRTDPANVMIEKAMRARLPTRPMSPRVSLDWRAVSGAS